MSKHSIDFDYLNWRPVLSTLQQLDAAGSASEWCLSGNAINSSAVYTGSHCHWIRESIIFQYYLHAATCVGWSNDRPTIQIRGQTDYNLLYGQALAAFSPSPTQQRSASRQRRSRGMSQGSHSAIGSGSGLFSRSGSRGMGGKEGVHPQERERGEDGGVEVQAPLFPPVSRGSRSPDSNRRVVPMKLVRSGSFLDEGELVPDVAEEEVDVYGSNALTATSRPAPEELEEAMAMAGVSRIRNIASCLTLHGAASQQAAEDLEVEEAGPRVSRDREGTDSPSRPGANGSGRGGALTFSSQYESHVRLTYARRGNRPDDGACRIRYSPLQANGYTRSASLVTNGQAVIPTLLRPVMEGTKMFRVQAYLHQYLSAGMEQDDLVTAFRSVTKTVNNYRDLK
jgi:hypothetical protein